MYAKLSTGNADIPAIGAMRDICRILTSNSPSVDDLLWFDTDASIIIDDTPAGWTYAGGNYESQSSGISTDANVTSTGYTVNTNYIMGVSAPTANDESLLKYVGFNISWLSAPNTLNNRFQMYAAEEISSTGVLTNPGKCVTWDGSQGEGESNTISLISTAGVVFHVVANQRGIVIVQEGRGMQAVWETNRTPVHEFFNSVPMVQYNHSQSDIFNQLTGSTFSTATVTTTAGWCTSVINVRNIATGILYGTYDPSETGTKNMQVLVNQSADLRKNTITSTGLPLYQVSPVFFQLGSLGYPVQYVTGVFPVYYTSGNIGTSGDTIIINNEEYIWFNAGPGFGLAMQTS